jgi:hypothetical protein
MVGRKGIEIVWFEVGRENDYVGKAEVPAHEEESGGIGKQGVILVC